MQTLRLVATARAVAGRFISVSATPNTTAEPIRKTHQPSPSDSTADVHVIANKPIEVTSSLDLNRPFNRLAKEEGTSKLVHLAGNGSGALARIATDAETSIAAKNSNDGSLPQATETFSNEGRNKRVPKNGVMRSKSTSIPKVKKPTLATAKSFTSQRRKDKSIPLSSFLSQQGVKTNHVTAKPHSSLNPSTIPLHPEEHKDLLLDQFSTLKIENLPSNFELHHLQTLLIILGKPIAYRFLRSAIATKAFVTLRTPEEACWAVECLQRMGSYKGRYLVSTLVNRSILTSINWQRRGTCTIDDIERLLVGSQFPHRHIRIRESRNDPSMVYMQLLVRDRVMAEQFVTAASRKHGGGKYDIQEDNHRPNFQMNGDDYDYKRYIIISNIPHQMSLAAIRTVILAGCVTESIEITSQYPNEPAQAVVELSANEGGRKQFRNCQENFRQHNLEFDVIVPLIIHHLPPEINGVDLHRLLQFTHLFRKPSFKRMPDSAVARVYVQSKIADQLIKDFHGSTYRGRCLSVLREEEPRQTLPSQSGGRTSNSQKEDDHANIMAGPSFTSRSRAVDTFDDNFPSNHFRKLLSLIKPRNPNGAEGQ